MIIKQPNRISVVFKTLHELTRDKDILSHSSKALTKLYWASFDDLRAEVHEMEAAADNLITRND